MNQCKKCGGVNLRLENKGNAIGLYCNSCNSWIKWVSKKELTQIQNEIEKNIKNTYEDDKDLIFEYETIGKRDMYWNIQCQLFAIDNENISDGEKYIEFVKVLNSLGQVQQMNESIGSTMELIEGSEVISDIRKDSINMREYFMNKYNR